MINSLVVFIGGGLGALCRYLIGLFIKGITATFLVNILGSLLLGFLVGIFYLKSNCNPLLKVALTIGFCGGFTTFSTFSLEALELIRQSNFTSAVLYIILSVVVCLIAVFVGAYFAKFA